MDHNPTACSSRGVGHICVQPRKSSRQIFNRLHGFEERPQCKKCKLNVVTCDDQGGVVLSHTAYKGAACFCTDPWEDSLSELF
jgi:hypothetical protein